MNSLGSLQLTLSTEIRRRTGNYALYPHPKTQFQRPMLIVLANPQILVDNEGTSAQVAGLYTSITDQRNSRLHVYLIICLRRMRKKRSNRSRNRKKMNFKKKEVGGREGGVGQWRRRPTLELRRREKIL